MSLIEYVLWVFLLPLGWLAMGSVEHAVNAREKNRLPRRRLSWRRTPRQPRQWRDS